MMTNERLTELFYQHLTEMEGGLGNLIWRLGDTYQDVKQDVLIKLITYNQDNVIIEDSAKALFFVSLKNEMIKKTRTFDRYDTISIDDDNCYIQLETEDSESTYDYELLDKLKAVTSTEDYQLMLRHFNKENKESISKKDFARITRIKTKIGFHKTHVLLFENGMNKEYTTISDMSRDLGISLDNLSRKIRKNKSFKYKGKSYRYKAKTNVNL